jgi:Xaa-Pro aminopeptidase
MSTHDVGEDFGPLRPGMVFTIEPSLLVPEENINIRCEDLIVITEQRAEVVSDFLPLDAAGIETLMQSNGMLQQYPSAKPMER